MPEKIMFAKKWEWPRNVTIIDCISNKGTMRKKHRIFRSWLHFVIILNSSIVLKIINMISIKVLISIEIAWFIPKCTKFFVDLSFTFFSCMLNTLIFTVDSYILKKYQCIPRPVTIAIVYSLGEHDFILSYCKMLIILYSNFERNYFIC